MHTARQLHHETFDVRIDGAVATLDALLPEWGPLDRLGVVVTSPFGGVGASHLLQAAIVAFYDARPERRKGVLRQGVQDPAAMYPDVFVFHVGGPWGDHSSYDVWPARKEVFLPTKPREVLDAINDRGITRLAVPDGPGAAVEHEWKEPAAARDRIASAFAYSPTGRPRDADVTITGTSAASQANTRMVLEGARALRRVLQTVPPADPGDDPDLVARRWDTRIRARNGEASDGLPQAVAARTAITADDGTVTEGYRRIDVDEALTLLVP